MKYVDEEKFAEKYRYMSKDDQRAVQRYLDKLNSVRRMEQRLNREERRVFFELVKDQSYTPENPPLSCSFCGKFTTEVDKMIAGPGVYICNECVELCDEILEEELPPKDDGK